LSISLYPHVPIGALVRGIIIPSHGAIRHDYSLNTFMSAVRNTPHNLRSDLMLPWRMPMYQKTWFGSYHELDRKLHYEPILYAERDSLFQRIHEPGLMYMHVPAMPAVRSRIPMEDCLIGITHPECCLALLNSNNCGQCRMTRRITQVPLWPFPK
jgi:hypothetical protein